MIRSVADIEKASDAVLRAFLKAENVKFSADALRPELIEEARKHVTEKAAKAPAPEKEPVTLPDETSADEALRQLDARGFKNREEIVAYLNALIREKDITSQERTALQEKTADLELRELELSEREKGLLKKAEEVHADLAKQSALYDKLLDLKKSFPADANINV